MPSIAEEAQNGHAATRRYVIGCESLPISMHGPWVCNDKTATITLASTVAHASKRKRTAAIPP